MINWLLQERLLQAPEIYPALDFKAQGVKALYYEGLPWRGEPTRVFAWYGAPETVELWKSSIKYPSVCGGQAFPKLDERLPAMVLVHGGGGTAFDEWVRLWNRRGYAAIAMDTCGCVPSGSYGNWAHHKLGGPPGWGGFYQIELPVEDQWTYHAVSDVILANSLLRSFPEIDPDRIGLTGISWGGYLVCIVSGVDHRFRFTVPVYGCGFLGDNSAWLPMFKEMGEEKSKKWLDLWDPSHYLRNTSMPMLWVTGTNDLAYPMDSLQKSYRLPKGKHTLCIRVRMPHGHGGPGENPEEIHAFASSFLKGAPPLAEITAQGIEKGCVWATFISESPIVKAELNFTRDSGDWSQRQWFTEPVDMDISSNKVTARLPSETKVCYLNLIDEKGLVVSTEY